MSKKRFRIAFSFAGEKRDFVSKVAAILAEKFGEEKILYDKYHEAEFGRARLGRYLPKLYHDDSDLIVAIICRDYVEKEWPGLEWDALFDLIKQREESEVMLCRFDHATIDGLFSDAGYVELDSKSPEQAANLILRRLALNEGKPKDFYTQSSGSTSATVPSTTIPNNLPRLESFFGRTEELKQITEALEPKTRTWGALIDGPGGQGKTSLAIRAAYDCTPDQFDRIIFLSVKSRELDDDGERELGVFILPGFLEMMNELARELGQPDINKAVESERIRLILDVLESQRVLLILDNLESLTRSDRGKLLTFVKRLPWGCKAILTSRRRIGSGSDLLVLKKLEEDAALETLAELALHNPLLSKTSEDQRVSLYNQTGGNPLLLRWTAGQLGRGSCRSIDDALAFLRRCPPANDPLEFIFGDLADEFTDDETKVLAALSYFSLPLRVEYIAEIANVEEQLAEMALRTLANRSLVIPDQEEIVFALVPIVADFLRRKRPEVFADTGNRLEERAHALVIENGYHQFDHFAALNDVWPIVASALPFLVVGANSQLQAVSTALDVFLEFTGRWDERLSINQQGETKALSIGDYLNAGWCAYRAGMVHNLREEATAVLDCAERASQHWQLTSQAGARERSIAIELRGLGHRLNDNYDSAISDFREALELRRSLSSESDDVASALNWLGDTERVSGDLDAARNHLSESLRIARKGGDPQGIVLAVGNLGALAVTRKDWQEAETLAREALSLSTSLGRLDLIAWNSWVLARALEPQGKREDATAYAKRAVEVYDSLNSPNVEAARATLTKLQG